MKVIDSGRSYRVTFEYTDQELESLLMVMDNATHIGSEKLGIEVFYHMYNALSEMLGEE